jgi:translation initiation factor 1A
MVCGLVNTAASYLPVCMKVWINGGDIILVGLRDYQDGKADVILKYSADEARNLKAYGELPESGRIIVLHLYPHKKIENYWIY